MQWSETVSWESSKTWSKKLQKKEQKCRSWRSSPHGGTQYCDCSNTKNDTNDSKNYLGKMQFSSRLIFKTWTQSYKPCNTNMEKVRCFNNGNLYHVVHISSGPPSPTFLKGNWKEFDMNDFPVKSCWRASNCPPKFGQNFRLQKTFKTAK